MGMGWRLLAIAGLLLTALASPVAQGRDPRVPPGIDPGGIAVAIIGGGIDYTRPHISVRLARDGEGELIGWDFSDNDSRPHEPCVRAAEPGCPTDSAEALLREFGGVRLITLKVDPHRPQTTVEAVGYLARLPVGIVLVSPEARAPAQLLAEAAGRHPAKLFIGSGDTATEETAAAANLILLPHASAAEAPRLAGQAARARTADPGLDAAALKTRVAGK